MRKKIIFGLMLLASMNSIAQEGPTDAISYLPQRANGFLILNGYNYADVQVWDVEIQTRNANIEDNSYTFSTVERLRIIGSNYSKIKELYRDGSFWVTVHGLNAQSNVIVEQGPLQINPDNVMTNSCGWKCIGSTYAYALNLYTALNDGSSVVNMESAVPESGEPYYYEWVSAANWPAFINSSLFTPNHNPQYYGLNDFNMYPLNQNNEGKIIHLNVVPPNYKVDASNSTISGSVYGVAKAWGPWVNQGPIYSNELIGGTSNCIQNFNWAMNSVNNGDNAPTTPLVCTGGNEYEPLETEAEANLDCITYIVSNSPEQIVELVNELNDCIENSENSGPGTFSNPFNWSEQIYSLTFTPYSSTDENDQVVITKNILFDENGNYIGTPITTLKGLYHVGIQYSDASYSRAFFEVQNESVSNLTNSDFLGVTVFPVPIVDDNFQISFVATARLSFVYVIKDSNGKVLYSNRYVIEKDKSFTETIAIEGGIPSGQLFNSITFEDDSVISFQTIK